MATDVPADPSIPSRVLVVAFVLGIFTLLARTPLFGFDPSKLDDLPNSVSMLFLEDVAIVDAAIVVELVARAVPRWRPLRNGSLDGRRRLRRAAIGLGLVAASVQSWFVGLALDSPTSGLADERFTGFIVPLVLLQGLAGFALIVVGAKWLDRVGIGAGFVWILGFFYAGAVVSWFEEANLEANHTASLTALLLAIASSVAIGALLVRPRTGSHAPLARTVGLVPIALASIAANAVTTLGDTFGASDVLGIRASPSQYFVLHSVLTCVFAVAIVSECARSRGGAQAGPAVDREALVRSVAALLLLLGIEGVVFDRLGIWFDATLVAIVPAIVLDLRSELAARRAHGALVQVASPSTMPDVDRVARALDEAGIPFVVRNERLRSLYHLFGPLYEAQVLVPASDVEDAREVLAVDIFA